jgi:hypothetical protein
VVQLHGSGEFVAETQALLRFFPHSCQYGVKQYPWLPIGHFHWCLFAVFVFAFDQRGQETIAVPEGMLFIRNIWFDDKDTDMYLPDLSKGLACPDTRMVHHHPELYGLPRVTPDFHFTCGNVTTIGSTAVFADPPCPQGTDPLRGCNCGTSDPIPRTYRHLYSANSGASLPTRPEEFADLESLMVTLQRFVDQHNIRRVNTQAETSPAAAPVIARRRRTKKQPTTSPTLTVLTKRSPKASVKKTSASATVTKESSSQESPHFTRSAASRSSASATVTKDSTPPEFPQFSHSKGMIKPVPVRPTRRATRTSASTKQSTSMTPHATHAAATPSLPYPTPMPRYERSGIMDTPATTAGLSQSDSGAMSPHAFQPYTTVVSQSLVPIMPGQTYPHVRVLSDHFDEATLPLDLSGRTQTLSTSSEVSELGPSDNVDENTRSPPPN